MALEGLDQLVIVQTAGVLSKDRVGGRQDGNLGPAVKVREEAGPPQRVLETTDVEERESGRDGAGEGECSVVEPRGGSRSATGSQAEGLPR